MTAASQIVAGSRILAAEIQGVAPLAVIKGADQPLASNTTLQNDNALFLPLVASATYWFQCFLLYEGGTMGASDLKIQWSTPSGATLRYAGSWMGTGGGVALGQSNGASLGSTVNILGTSGAASLQAATMIGTLFVASTGGPLQLTWAQNSSSSTPTIVHAQSGVALWRIT